MDLSDILQLIFVVDFGGNLGTSYGIPVAQEVFNKTSEASGSVLASYEPMASHGGPARAPNHAVA